MLVVLAVDLIMVLLAMVELAAVAPEIQKMVLMELVVDLQEILVVAVATLLVLVVLTLAAVAVAVDTQTETAVQADLELLLLNTSFNKELIWHITQN